MYIEQNLATFNMLLIYMYINNQMIFGYHDINRLCVGEKAKFLQ